MKNDIYAPLLQKYHTPFTLLRLYPQMLLYDSLSQNVTARIKYVPFTNQCFMARKYLKESLENHYIKCIEISTQAVYFAILYLTYENFSFCMFITWCLFIFQIIDNYLFYWNTTMFFSSKMFYDVIFVKVGMNYYTEISFGAIV